MKWGMRENSCSSLVGAVFGFAIGVFIGVSLNNTIYKTDGMSMLIPASIGGCIGSTVFSIISHNFIYNKEKKEAEKRILQ